MARSDQDEGWGGGWGVVRAVGAWGPRRGWPVGAIEGLLQCYLCSVALMGNQILRCSALPLSLT